MACASCVNGECVDSVCQCDGLWTGSACDDRAVIDSPGHYLVAVWQVGFSLAISSYAVAKLVQSRRKASDKRWTRVHVILILMTIANTVYAVQTIANWEGRTENPDPAKYTAHLILDLAFISTLVASIQMMLSIWQSAVDRASGYQRKWSYFKVSATVYISTYVVLAFATAAAIDRSVKRSMQQVSNSLGTVLWFGNFIMVGAYGWRVISILRNFGAQNAGMIYRIKLFLKQYYCMSLLLLPLSVASRIVPVSADGQALYWILTFLNSLAAGITSAIMLIYMFRPAPSSVAVAKDKYGVKARPEA